MRQEKWGQSSFFNGHKRGSGLFFKDQLAADAETSRKNRPDPFIGQSEQKQL
jgi:hypothetical protein